MKRYIIILIQIFYFSNSIADISPIGYYFSMSIELGNGKIYDCKSECFYFMEQDFNDDSLKLFSNDNNSFKRFIVANLSSSDSLTIYSLTYDFHSFSTIFPINAKIKEHIKNIKSITYLNAHKVPLGCAFDSPISIKDLDWIKEERIIKIDKLLTGGPKYTFFFYELTETNNAAVYEFQSSIMKGNENYVYQNGLLKKLLDLKVLVEVCENQ